MKLYFKSEHVEFSVNGHRLLTDSDPFLRASMTGRSIMETDDDSNSPVSDTYSVDFTTSELMKAVPLLTFVFLQSAKQFPQARAYRTDWLGKESLEEPESVEAAASVFYSEAGSEFSSYHGGHAIVSVNLKVGDSILSNESILMSALQNNALSIDLELTGIEFTTHERMRERWGIPTLGAFLEGRAEAFASEYALRFTSSAPLRYTLGGRSRTSMPTPFKSTADVVYALSTWPFVT